MHRAFAMSKPKLRLKDGLDVGATVMFMSMLAKAARRAASGKIPSTHFGVAFDPPRADSWRRHLCPTYKAHRPDMAPAFVAQVPLMKECVRAAGFALLEAPNHEADDLLAAYAMDGAQAGGRVTMVTPDKDLMQLVSSQILVWDSQRDIWYTQSKVLEKFEVPADRLGDYLALAGDTADGIEGARGIGPKKARSILQSGTLAEVLADPDRIADEKLRAKVIESRGALALARSLVALDVAGCPRPVALEGLRTVYPQGASQRLYDWSSEVLLAGGVAAAPSTSSSMGTGAGGV